MINNESRKKALDKLIKKYLSRTMTVDELAAFELYYFKHREVLSEIEAARLQLEMRVQDDDTYKCHFKNY